MANTTNSITKESAATKAEPKHEQEAAQHTERKNDQVVVNAN